MANKLSSLFISIAKIIDDFEHKPILADNDINISNWITQVLSNEDFEHKIHLTGKAKGNEFDFTSKDKFNPASMKGNANAYQKGMRIGKFVELKDKTYTEFTEEQYINAFQTLLAYVVGWLTLGKPLATVNMARGKILLHIIDTLKITDMKAVIYGVSLGGSKPKADIEINQDELTLLAQYHNLRGERIMTRDDNEGNSTTGHVNAVTQDAVTSIKPIKF